MLWWTGTHKKSCRITCSNVVVSLIFLLPCQAKGDAKVVVQAFLNINEPLLFRVGRQHEESNDEGDLVVGPNQVQMNEADRRRGR